MIKEISRENIDKKIQLAVEAYQFLKNSTIKERAAFMNAVADKIEALGEELLTIAHAETSLPLARLEGEKARTAGQWRTYAGAVASGMYTEPRIDISQPGRQKNDVRKYHIGIGPVVVFGASNFPFAFSTAGGDTAGAIGSGSPVIVKAHPAHPETSQMMADAITEVVKDYGWPEGVFSHITGSSYDTGAYLTRHSDIRAVAFTGSFKGGKALFDIASQRKEPIPVFAEMGSINPVFAFPRLLESKPQELAKEYAASLTLGVGQFCTNPGVCIAMKGENLDKFKEMLKDEISTVSPGNMLHKGIFENFERLKGVVSAQPEVKTIAEASEKSGEGQGRAIVVETTGKSFLENDTLGDEVFGPLGIVVACDTAEEILEIARQLKGQLTITVAATDKDLGENLDLVRLLQDKCGRLLFNGMPTGVEVVYAMQHGGPFPSTTDARFTSVGPDSIKRFLRPVSFQNWPDEFLPLELRNENPLKINRLVDGKVHSGSLKF